MTIVQPPIPTTVIRYKLTQAKWIDQMAFEISRVPCNFQMFHFDVAQNVLVETTDRAGHKVVGTVTSATKRPQGVRGDWRLKQLDTFVPFLFELPMIETTMIELHVDRNVQPIRHDTRLKKAIRSYPITLRNVDLVLKFDDWQQITPTLEENVTITSPLGHIERLMVDQWDSSKAIDDEPDTFWKCSPQPVGDAIVPFYLDVRDPAGDAQLIDRMELDPIFTGPHMNVYYSNDETRSGMFQVANKRRLLDMEGTVDWVTDKGPNFDAIGKALSLDNNDMRLDLTRDWSIGITWSPNDASTAATAVRPIWSFDRGAAAMGDTGPRVRIRPSTDWGVQSGSTSDYSGRYPAHWRLEFFDIPADVYEVDMLGPWVNPGTTGIDIPFISVWDTVPLPTGDWVAEWDSAIGLFSVTVGTRTMNAYVGTNFSRSQWATYDWTPHTGTGTMSFGPTLSSNGPLQTDWSWSGADEGFWDPAATTLMFDTADDKFKIVNDYLALGEVLIESAPTTFAASGTVRLIVSRQQGVGWTLRVAVDGGTDLSTSAVDLAQDTNSLRSFFIGSDVALTQSARGTLRDVWARQEASSLAANDAYVNNSRNFMLRTGPFDPTRSDYNAVLLGRLLLDESVNVGPSDAVFDMKEWTPVYRDFRLFKGILEMPPVRCKYLKLEFTNLVARPYPLWEGGIDRVVKDYPQWVHRWYGEVETKAREVVDSRYPTWLSGIGNISLGNIPGLATALGGSGGGSTGSKTTQIRIDYGNGKTTTWSTTDAALVEGITGHTAVAFEGGSQLAFDPSQYGAYTATVMPSFGSGGGGGGGLGAYFDFSHITPQTHTVLEQIYKLYQRKFFRVVRHQYDVRTVKTTWNQAYFVGLRDVKVYRVDYTAVGDDPEYIETFDDNAHLETFTMTRDSDTLRMHATAAGNSVTSKTLPSFSKFQSLQIAAVSSQFEPILSDGQMDLVTYSHLVPLTNTTQTDSTAELTGDGIGQVLCYTPNSGAPQVYGVRTDAGLINAESGPQYDYAGDVYNTSASYDAAFASDPDKLRMSVMARFYLPDTANGTYRLRLYSGVTVVAERVISDLSVRRWIEAELHYYSTSGSTDLRAEIAQVNTAVTERFALDFFGIFTNPLLWEISNDAGTTWHEIHSGIGNPDYFITLPALGNQLKVRITARRAGAWVQRFVIVPVYINSPHRTDAFRALMDQSASNESDALRDVHDRPSFKTWSRSFPRRYSIDTLHTVPI